MQYAVRIRQDLKADHRRDLWKKEEYNDPGN
jgi:hypothetical protein